MKRKLKKADAILTGDWHLRDTTPTARTDDFWEVQWEKLDYISRLQKKHDCLVIHAADLFDFWKPSPMLLAKTIQHLPDNFYTIYGNHDLPQHNLELAYKSGIHVLEQAGKLKILNYNCHINGHTYDGVHWNTIPVDSEKRANHQILVWHIMTYQGKKPWPGCTDPRGAKLLRKYPEYDLILTGHNHKPFVEKYKNRLLVNPGSIFRMSADQQDHLPRVYLWYADTNTVEAVYLPITEDVISRAHLEEKKARDGRIDAFISTLQTEYEDSHSFAHNIDEFFKTNTVNKIVKDIVYKALEHDKT